MRVTFDAAKLDDLRRLADAEKAVSLLPASPEAAIDNRVNSKLHTLKCHIMSQFATNQASRVLVFVQQRAFAHAIARSFRDDISLAQFGVALCTGVHGGGGGSIPAPRAGNEHGGPGGSRGNEDTSVEGSGGASVGGNKDASVGGNDATAGPNANGVSGGNYTGPSTMRVQEHVLKEFKEGSKKILVCTSVAEEGIDVQACNLVIRYCMLFCCISRFS